MDRKSHVEICLLIMDKKGGSEYFTIMDRRNHVVMFFLIMDRRGYLEILPLSKEKTGGWKYFT